MSEIRLIDPRAKRVIFLPDKTSVIISGDSVIRNASPVLIAHCKRVNDESRKPIFDITETPIPEPTVEELAVKVIKKTRLKKKSDKAEQTKI